MAVVGTNGLVEFSNSALEDALGISRRTIVGSALADTFTEPSLLLTALHGVRDNAFAVLRYDAFLKRMGTEPMPVHVIISWTEPVSDIIVEMIPLEQQTRQDREERLAEQAQTNKELIRNLAHEIKNPLGGIRGAAQLLEMEMESPDLNESFTKRTGCRVWSIVSWRRTVGRTWSVMSISMRSANVCGP